MATETTLKTLQRKAAVFRLFFLFFIGVLFLAALSVVSLQFYSKMTALRAHALKESEFVFRTVYQLAAKSTKIEKQPDVLRALKRYLEDSLIAQYPIHIYVQDLENGLPVASDFFMKWEDEDNEAANRALAELSEEKRYIVERHEKIGFLKAYMPLLTDYETEPTWMVRVLYNYPGWKETFEATKSMLIVAGCFSLFIFLFIGYALIRGANRK